MEIVQQWKNQPQQSFPVIAFGSSNTELSWGSEGRHNWVDWLGINLRANIGRHVCMINQGIGGETTADLLGRMERDVFPYRPALVIVTIGGNDANQGVSASQFADNMSRICDSLQERGALPVLHTYYCPQYHLSGGDFERRFDRFMEEIRLLAARTQVPLVDQYKRFERFYRQRPDQYARLMRDWLHVNALGNMIMGMNISREFGLPEIPVPEDIREETLELLGQMEACCQE